MEDFSEDCYIGNKKIKRFSPEKEIEYLKYDEKLWKRIFPFQRGLDYKKLKLTNIGVYSASKKGDLDKLISYLQKEYGDLKKKVIIDGNGGVGNTTLFLSYVFGMVVSVEIMKKHADLIENNMKVYGRKNVKVMNYDFFDIGLKVKSNFVLFDMPWGGKKYAEKNKLILGFNNVRISCIINKLIDSGKIMDGIILFCPYNFDIGGFVKRIKIKNIKKIGLKKHYWVVIKL